MNYIKSRSKLIKDYFKILSDDFPEWLDDYIETEKMLKQQYISVTCGKIYSKMFNYNDFSSLEHSIAVALIIWNFTHDKKQTLAGLFHDIATPAFKHCIDFLNGDYMDQESIEELTELFIRDSKDIVELLEKDNIKVEEVCDYHIYPIADNDTPYLSADRLEYSLSNSLFVFGITSIDEIKEMYDDIEIEYNESDIIELGFKTKKLARKFVSITSEMSILYRDDKTRFFMQAMADIVKKVSDDGLITKKDLYKLKEIEVVDIIKNSKYSDIFNKLINIEKVNVSEDKPEGIYCINHGAKVRYIDPLYNGKRISSECKIAKRMIDNNLAYNMDNFVYFDKDFNVLSWSESMKVLKSESDFGIDIYLKNDDKYVAFTFGGNGDLYWSIHNGKECNSSSFTITKENYNVYQLFEKLYFDIKNINLFNEDEDSLYLESKEDKKQCLEYLKEKCRLYNYANYNELFDDNNKTITWYSDETNHKVANILKIKKDKDIFRLDFDIQKSIDEYDDDFNSLYCIPIRFRNSGSSYDPFNTIFMKMYNEMRMVDDVNDFGHQIHIEEYLYDRDKVKKLVRN